MSPAIPKLKRPSPPIIPKRSGNKVSKSLYFTKNIKLWSASDIAIRLHIIVTVLIRFISFPLFKILIFILYILRLHVLHITRKSRVNISKLQFSFQNRTGSKPIQYRSQKNLGQKLPSVKSASVCIYMAKNSSPPIHYELVFKVRGKNTSKTLLSQKKNKRTPIRSVKSTNGKVKCSISFIVRLLSTLIL